MGDAIQDVADDPDAVEGGDKEEEASDEADNIGEGYIVEEAGSEFTIAKLLEEGGLVWGDIFLGAGVVLGVMFVVLSFVFHNTTQYAGVWNLARHRLVWMFQFKESNNTDKGQLAIGPVVFDSNNKINIY
ncbi:Ff.00g063270.m01.CDS01 [Fusarium sp. VM40]|nr:Ff.00g063270.m01.CDS01 [Fusarium sp. VM40]